MEIDYNLQTIIPRPTDSLNEIVVLPLDIRLAGPDLIGPIPDWDAHVIESKVGINASMFSNGATKTDPALAIISKSTSVIHVFQWFTNVVFATLRS